jgi:sec-independent protein translocase protein TatA
VRLTLPGRVRTLWRVQTTLANPKNRQVAEVPNIGLPELVIVLVIALVVFGPKRLPQMGRQLGQALREFKSATAEVRAQVGIDEIADSVKDIKSSFSLTGDATGQAAVDAVPEPASLDVPVDTTLPDAPVEAAPGTMSVDPPAAPTPLDEAPTPVDPPSAANAGPPPEAALPPVEGGIEAFGKLKRGSGSAARTTAD